MRTPALALALGVLCVGTPVAAQEWSVEAGESTEPERDEGEGEPEVMDEAELDQAYEEEDEIELSPEELAELEDDEWDVSAFGTAREVKRVAGSAHRVDAEQLERFEDDNIHNVLRRSVPGVYVRGEDGFGLRPNIGLRGANSDRSKKITLMEDGVLFGPAPYSAPAAYYFPLTTRMTALEVFKGASALRHGPHTIGGAINMVTRPIPWGHELGADIAYGVNNYGKGHVHYGYGTDHWGVLVEAVRLRSDGFKEIRPNPNNLDTGFDKIETMIKARVNTNPAGEIYNEGQIKLGYSREQSNETYLGLTDADFREDPFRRYPASALDHMRWDRFQIELSHLLGVGDWLRMRTTAYRHDFHRAWFRFDNVAPLASVESGARPFDILRNPDSTTNAAFYQWLTGQEDSPTGLLSPKLNIVDNDRTFVAQGIQSSASIKLPRLWRIDQKLKTGLRFHYDSIDRLQTYYAHRMQDGRMVPDTVAGPPGLGPITANTPASVNEASTYALAGYLVDEIALWRFLISPGARLEFATSEFDDALSGRRIERQQGVLLPGVGVLFQATEEISLLTGIHQGYSPVVPGAPEAAEPERSVNYEFGSRFDSAILGGEVVGFVSDYSNLTELCGISRGCVDEDTQIDAGPALVWGVEVSGKSDIPTPTDLTIPLTVAYTYTKGTYEGSFPDPGTGQQVTSGVDMLSIPNHIFGATAGLASKRWGSFVLGASYVDRVLEVPTPDPGPGDETDAYVIFDAAATLQVMEELAVYAKAENLLDNEYIISRRPFGARPGRPRFVYAGVKVQMD